MSRLLVGRGLALILGVTLAVMSSAETRQRPDNHPCTGAEIPFAGEQTVVQAAECMFQGRVVKVERVSNRKTWAYRLRILLKGGRIKTVDLNPQTGLPTNPGVLEEVYEALDRRG